MRIQQFTLGELADYVKSGEYNHLHHLPISSLRAESQFHNPSADPSEIALIVAFEEPYENLGYIGILPGYMNTPEGKIKIYWNTCWWVDPEKGRGIAIPLFMQFLKLTRGKTVIKGLTPHTKKIVSRARELVEVADLEGMRFFFRFYLSGMGGKFKWFRPLFYISDRLFNLCFQTFQKLVLPALNVQSEFMKAPDDECSAFIKKMASGQLFNRDADEISWICNYPWLTTDSSFREDSDKYYFSFLVKSFSVYLAKLRQNDRLVALIMFSERDGHFRTPYVYCEKKDAGIVSDFITEHLILKKAKSYYTHNPLLIEHSNKFKRYAYHVKHQNEDLTISAELVPYFSKDLLVQDGDGDIVFT